MENQTKVHNSLLNNIVDSNRLENAEEKQNKEHADDSAHFNSVSLISLGSSNSKRKHREKRSSKNVSTFDAFLSKSTYFQTKSSNLAIPNLNLRPFSTDNTKSASNNSLTGSARDRALGVTLDPIDKDILNRYQRVKPVDIVKSNIKLSSLKNNSNNTLHNNSDEGPNQSPLKIKFETTKNTQVLTIEENENNVWMELFL